MTPTQEALRLFAERTVRITAIAAVGSLLAAVVSTALAIFTGPTTTGLNWYLCGLTAGFALSVWGALLLMVKNTRVRLAAEEEERATIGYMAKLITAELERAGDRYEALLTPAGIVVQRRKPREPSQFH